MGVGLALAVVCAPVLQRLQLSAAVTQLVPVTRIVDDASSRPTYPYILVEGATERPFNTMGAEAAPKWGGVARVSVRVVSQYRGEQEARQVMSAIKQELDGRPLAVPGYPTAIVEFETATFLKDTVAGIVTRELVADFEVTIHQS